MFIQSFQCVRFLFILTSNLLCGHMNVCLCVSHSLQVLNIHWGLAHTTEMLRLYGIVKHLLCELAFTINLLSIKVINFFLRLYDIKLRSLVLFSFPLALCHKNNAGSIEHSVYAIDSYMYVTFKVQNKKVFCNLYIVINHCLSGWRK